MPNKIEEAKNGQRDNNVAKDLGPDEISAHGEYLFQMGYKFRFSKNFPNVMLSHLQAEKICDQRTNDEGSHNDNGSFIVGVNGQ
jgi:hypothetical protein